MQCNQPFYGNGFTNGQFYSCNNTPLQCSQNMCPEIVGEGEVTSVALPDGTIQFFFMPTMKWWAPNASQCHPNMANPMYANTNFNFPHNNNNVGTWFVRSISNPFPPNMYNVPPQRSEVPRLNYNSDYNMNTTSNGYQLKFHNDNWTSTTDLHYFCPSLRQRDYTVRQPCRGTTSMQVETAVAANNTNHYEIVCSKPCNCNVVGSKPMSIVSLVEPKTNTKSNRGSTDDCSCEEVSKSHRQAKKDSRHKPKNVVCACESTAKVVTADKSVTTYTDEGSSCTPAGGRETQTCQREKQKSQSCSTKLLPQSCCERPVPVLKLPLNCCEPPAQKKTDNVLQRCEVRNAEIWKPITSLSKKGIESKSSENLIDTSDHDEYNGGCSSNCSCYSG